MSRFTKYVIESRNERGELLLGGTPQPESFFGMGAIHGMTDDQMAQAIFRAVPDASLPGDSIPNWPKLINPNWAARVKAW